MERWICNCSLCSFHLLDGVFSRTELSLINQSRRSSGTRQNCKFFCIGRRAFLLPPRSLGPGTRTWDASAADDFRSYLLLLRSQPRECSAWPESGLRGRRPTTTLPGLSLPQPRPLAGLRSPAASPVVSGRRRLAVPYLAALLVAQVSALHVETRLPTTAGPVGNRPESLPAVPARPTREIRAAAAGSPPPRTVPTPRRTPFLVTTNQNADPSTAAQVVPPLRTMESANDFFPLDSTPFLRLLPILPPKGFWES